MNIAATKDIIQEVEGNLEKPEIRVWCHPHRIGKSGSDGYKVFPSFQEALVFIKCTKEAERRPLVAFRGYEINLWSIEALVGDILKRNQPSAHSEKT